jgi:hypothetical protein
MIIGRRSRKCMPPPTIQSHIEGGSLREDNNTQSNITTNITETKIIIEEDISTDPINVIDEEKNGTH